VCATLGIISTCAARIDKAARIPHGETSADPTERDIMVTKTTAMRARVQLASRVELDLHCDVERQVLGSSANDAGDCSTWPTR